MEIIIIYSQDSQETIEKFKESIEEANEEYVILGGDFNAKTGNRGGLREEEEEIGRRKACTRPKNKIRNKEGNILIEGIEERGWMIVNGSLGEEGDWTHTYVDGGGASVIDYVITNEKAWEEVIGIREGNRTESDHLSLEAKVRGEGTVKEGKKSKGIQVERNV